jgi:hypothetical protein
VVVWYDVGATLVRVVHEAVPDGVQLLRYDGSYLELRTQLEEADPRLERSWLLYIPERRPEPSWLRDLELAGELLEFGLDGLVSDAFDVATTARLRTLLAGPPGRILAARWDELVPRNVTAIDLERAMVTGVLELGANARLQEIAIEYVMRADAPERLGRADLHPELRRLLEIEGGLGGLPSGEVPQQRVAAALLLSEAIVRGGLNPQAFGEAIPSADSRPQWCAWAEAWMRWSDDRSFPAWSERISRLYQMPDHLIGLGIADVEVFAAVDDVLVKEAERLLDEGERRLLREVADRRCHTYWARAAEQRGEPLPWTTVIAAIDLLDGAEAAVRELSTRRTWPLDEVFKSYGNETGWWRLDDAYRRLEAGWSRLPEGIAKRLRVPAARAYGGFLDLLGIATCTAMDAVNEWSINGWEPQRVVAARVLGDGSRVTLILADALRFDLGRLLAERLRGKGLDVEIIPTLANLPSVTKVGMAAVQSPRWEERKTFIERGSFLPQIDTVVLRGREERLAQLRSRFPQAVGTELDAIQEGRSLPRAAPLVVYAGAVDEQGDALPQIGLDLFERLVWGVAAGVERLLTSGYTKVVVIPDHGFVLAPREHNIRKVEIRGGDGQTARAWRYVIGLPAESDEMVRIPLARLGWRNDGAAAFPRGLALMALPGEVPRYFHGGPMPQEVAVLTLICRRPESAAPPVSVRITRPEHIDTTRPRFSLEGESAGLFSQPRRVRVVVRLEGRVVGESDAVEIKASEQSEVTVNLARYGKQVEVVAEDIETREPLAVRTIPVSLPPGYEDFDL